VPLTEAIFKSIFEEAALAGDSTLVLSHSQVFPIKNVRPEN
jgi:hypothetical protein